MSDEIIYPLSVKSISLKKSKIVKSGCRDTDIFADSKSLERSICCLKVDTTSLISAEEAENSWVRVGEDLLSENFDLAGLLKPAWEREGDRRGLEFRAGVLGGLDPLYGELARRGLEFL